MCTIIHKNHPEARILPDKYSHYRIYELIQVWVGLAVFVGRERRFRGRCFPRAVLSAGDAGVRGDWDRRWQTIA